MKSRIVSAPACCLPTSSCEALAFKIRGGSRPVLAFESLIYREFRAHRTLGYYAQQLHVSPNYLNALCQRHRQQTASALLHARILAEAKCQLVQSRVPVAEIARALGFTNASYFRRYFKRHVLLTPRAFRRLSRSGNELASPPR